MPPTRPQPDRSGWHNSLIFNYFRPNHLSQPDRPTVYRDPSLHQWAINYHQPSTNSMYTNKTRNLFIELRAQGLSLARISAQIKVSKNTLIDWNRQLREEIEILEGVE